MHAETHFWHAPVIQERNTFVVAFWKAENIT